MFLQVSSILATIMSLYTKIMTILGAHCERTDCPLHRTRAMSAPGAGVWASNTRAVTPFLPAEPAKPVLHFMVASQAEPDLPVLPAVFSSTVNQAK